MLAQQLLDSAARVAKLIDVFLYLGPGALSALVGDVFIQIAGDPFTGKIQQVIDFE